jgi:glucose/arabinose dehydrogenase
MTAWTSSILAVATLCSPAVLQAQGAPGPDTVSLGDDKFAQACAVCHGAEGVGAAAPTLIGARPLGHGDEKETLEREVREGIPPQMPAFESKLTEPEIKAVVAYIQAKRFDAATRLQATLMARASEPPKGVIHSDVHDFRIEMVAQMGTPYGFDFLPDKRILVTEVAGKLRIVDKGHLLPEPVADAPTGDPHGLPDFFKRGMLDLIVHPDYKTNGWIYLLTAQMEPGADGHRSPQATITRGRLHDNRWVDSQEVLKFSIEKSSALRLAFDSHNFLYVGTGYSIDEAYTGPKEAAPAQDLSTPWGKILRLKDDGSVPADNPFVGRKDAFPYIWSYGHREPLGLAFSPQGELWETENGPRGGDELNHILPGRNYGWPVSTWGFPYDDKPFSAHPSEKGMQQPVFNWTPSPALSAITFYTGKAFPRWKNNILMGSLKQRDLFRIIVDGDRGVLQEVILHNIDRIRDVKVGPEGYVYLLTDSGMLLRLIPAAGRRG